MHRKLLITTAALASLSLLTACGRGGEQQGAADQRNEPVNVAQDAVGAAVGLGSAATVGATTVEGYVASAAIGDMYEIQSSQLALERSQSADVKMAAQMIIADHTQATNDLKALVAGGQVAGVTLPTEMDERRKGMIDNLRGATAQDFDDRYLDQQTMAHHEALTLHNGYKTVGQHAALKAHADKVAPKIQMHVEMITKLDRSTNADDGKGAAAPATQHR